MEKLRGSGRGTKVRTKERKGTEKFSNFPSFFPAVGTHVFGFLPFPSFHPLYPHVRFNYSKVSPPPSFPRVFFAPPRAIADASKAKGGGDYGIMKKLCHARKKLF